MTGTISVPKEFVELSTEYHGGQTSPMYSVSSTGKTTVQQLWFLHDEVVENLNADTLENAPKEYRSLRNFKQWVVWIIDPLAVDLDWED